MICNLKSEVDFLAYKYLEGQDDEVLFNYLHDLDAKVRTIAGKVIQLRGSDELFEKVIGLKNTKTYYLREICAFILGQFKTARQDFLAQIPVVLLELSKDNSISVKTTAMYALGHFYGYHPMSLPLSKIDKQVKDTLLSYSTHHLSSVRVSCAFALSGLPDEKAVRDTLNQLLDDECSEVSEWAEVSLEILDDRLTK